MSEQLKDRAADVFGSIIEGFPYWLTLVFCVWALSAFAYLHIVAWLR